MITTIYSCRISGNIALAYTVRSDIPQTSEISDCCIQVFRD